MILKKEKEIMQISGRKRIISAFILGSYFSLLCPFTMNAQSFTVYISRSEFMNYYMTCFGYAFKDGGYIALILLLTALGYFYSSIDKKQLKNDIITDSVKIWGYQTLLFTMSIYPLASYNNVMTLVYVFIITSEMLTIERCVD